MEQEAKTPDISTNNTDMTPAQREAAKTRQQRAEDIAYTLNHALACTASDAFDAYGANKLQPLIGNGIKYFSIHYLSDTFHDFLTKTGLLKEGPHAHKCDHKHGFWDWFIGEASGDFGAVPITIALQRFAPGFMNGLRKMLEPVLGWAFHIGAKRSAGKWAAEQGLSRNSQEYKDRVKELYDYEVRHLPQMAVWTGVSTTINVAMQKFLSTTTAQNGLKKVGIKGVHGNHGSILEIAATKATVAFIVGTIVVTLRVLFPSSVKKWDHLVGEKVFLPLTKKVGKKIGVDEESVDRMAEEHERLKGESWSERVKPAAARDTAIPALA